MVKLDDILGKYSTSEKDGKSGFANNFILIIFKKEEQIKFNFEMRTVGSFGIVGKNWYGIGIFRSDHLALIIEKESDWTYTKDDDEKVEFARSKNESLPIEIYTDEERVVIYHKNLDRYILLNKENIEITEE